MINKEKKNAFFYSIQEKMKKKAWNAASGRISKTATHMWPLT